MWWGSVSNPDARRRVICSASGHHQRHQWFPCCVVDLSLFLVGLRGRSCGLFFTWLIVVTWFTHTTVRQFRGGMWECYWVGYCKCFLGTIVSSTRTPTENLICMHFYYAVIVTIGSPSLLKHLFRSIVEWNRIPVKYSCILGSISEPFFSLKNWNIFSFFCRKFLTPCLSKWGVLVGPRVGICTCWYWMRPLCWFV